MIDRDINNLAEPFQTAVRSFIEVCNEAGLHIFVTEARRTTERQQELYAQGRTKPGSIVTWLDGVNTISKHQAL